MIRAAVPSDLAAVRAVELSAATVFIGTHMDFAANHAPNHPDDLLAAMAAGLMWVACAAEDVVGFGFAEGFAEGLYVRELSVAAAFQQQGQGSALLRAIVAAGRQRGDRQLMLTTDRTLPWNAPFYRRFGFVIVEGEAIPAVVQGRLAGQYAAGFDPAQRCAMVMPL
jgi:GNAT superfamily N-acetyltransferase